MKNAFGFGFALVLLSSTSISQAAIVQMNFSGTSFSSFDVYSTGYTPDSTPFSGLITYDTNSIGVTDPNFSYIQDYASAVTSFSLNFGGVTYVATNGSIQVSHGGPNNADAISFRVFPAGSSISGLVPQEFDLGLRDFSGTVFGNQSLPQNYTLNQFQSGSGNGGGGTSTFYLNDGTQNRGPFGTPQIFGVLSSADASVASVPEPENYAMLLAGLGIIGAFAKRSRSKPA